LKGRNFELGRIRIENFSRQNRGDSSPARRPDRLLPEATQNQFGDRSCRALNVAYRLILLNLLKKTIPTTNITTLKPMTAKRSSRTVPLVTAAPLVNREVRASVT